MQYTFHPIKNKVPVSLDYCEVKKFSIEVDKKLFTYPKDGEPQLLEN